MRRTTWGYYCTPLRSVSRSCPARDNSAVSLHLLSLESNHRISQQVSEVKLAPLLDDISMFANKQPPDMGEEETPAGIVRVSIGLWVLVVDSVVPGPLKDVILQREHRSRVKRQSTLLESFSGSPWTTPLTILTTDFRFAPTINPQCLHLKFDPWGWSGVVSMKTRGNPSLEGILACVWDVPAAGGSGVLNEREGEPESSGGGYGSLLGDHSCQEKKDPVSRWSLGCQRRGATLSMKEEYERRVWCLAWISLASLSFFNGLHVPLTESRKPVK